VSERKTRLQSFLDRVWSGGEIDACGDYLGPSYTIEHDPGDPWEGRTLDLAGFKDRVRQSRAPFPDQRFDVQAMLADDAGVAVSWTWSATHQGDIPGFPATGAPLRMSGMTLYRFDADDRIIGHRQVSDRLTIFQQLQGARKS
jgi:steroid delta-isomerase-like uncharacterized protein